MDPPIKLMSLDVDWSAPEWLATLDPTQPQPIHLADLFTWPAPPGAAAPATACPAPATTAPLDGGAEPPPVPYKNPSSAWQVAVNAATAAAPEEHVAYTYDEGAKCGVLRIRGRSVVNDEKVKRPALPDEVRLAPLACLLCTLLARCFSPGSRPCVHRC